LQKKRVAVFNEESEAKTNQCLEENLQLINVMRENLVSNKVNENVELMRRFHGNLVSVMRMYVRQYIAYN
jgi:hypothetical protein